MVVYRRTHEGDREDRNVEMYGIRRPSGPSDYEDIDNRQMSGHAQFVGETLTVSALYASVTAGNSDSTEDRNMQSNPAYGHLSCD